MVADLFHYGHVNFLRTAREHGDYLLVGVHSDEVVRSYKRTPIFSMEERIASVVGCKYVDDVVPNAPLTITREWIEQHEINLVVHGDDFPEELFKRFYEIPIEMGIFRTVTYTRGISTSEIITRCKAFDLD